VITPALPSETKKSILLATLAAVVAGVLTAATNSLAALIFLGLCAGILAMITPPITLLLVWLFFSPLLTGSRIALGVGIPDISFDRILFIVFLAQLLFVKVGKKIAVRKLDTADILLTAFLVWAAFSTIFLRRLELSKQMIALWEQFIFPIGMYWIIQQIIDNERRLNWAFVTLTALLVLIGFPAIPESITGINILGGNAQHLDSVIRASSFFRSPWEFGGTLVMLSIVSLYPFIYKTRANLKWLGFAGFWGGLFGVLLSFMRGAWLALSVGLFSWLIISKKFRKYLYLGVPLLVVLLMSALPILVTTAVWRERITNRNNIIFRTTVSKQQVNLILQKPLTGNGLKPSSVEYIAATNYYDWGVYEITIPSHNTFLSMFVDFGAFALLYYAAIGAILLKAALYYKKFSRHLHPPKEIVALLAIAVLAHLINSATFETRFFVWLNALMWTLLALLNSTIHIYNPSQSELLTTDSHENLK